ncbi:BON domain-containing protein [Roseiconus nitratireducens]|uniref:BON domain-containing protein n=1 Tax=Roseiconus nitratireducens TaxID=2605748 RepID=UPI0013759C49|nr:BON domain-containing protein [Roseiconus nitratireducens]
MVVGLFLFSFTPAWNESPWHGKPLAAQDTPPANQPAESEASGEETIPDAEIAMAVDGELWGAKGVNANRIDVSVERGVVTLDGTVKTILAKDRASRIAGMIKGVRSIIDRLDVQPTIRTDGEIRSDVIAALESDPATDDWEFEIAVDDAVVTLGGDADSHAQQSLATKIIKGVRGVKEIKNETDIRYEDDRSDAEIRTEIQHRLRWDARLDDEQLSVEVDNGEVTLSGIIGSRYEKTLARDDAWVSGVRSVQTDELEVQWWARDKLLRKQQGETVLSNAAISEAVRDTFQYDPRVNAFNLTAICQNGTVTLIGNVDNLKAKRAAAQNAINTTGVWRVKNYLKVRPKEARTAEQIVRDVRMALIRDPVVDRFDIEIESNDGTVYLYGSVDSYFQKAEAEDIVAKVNGVTDVANHLTVSYDQPSFRFGYDWDATRYNYNFDYAKTRQKSDREIEDDVRTQLRWSPFVDEQQVAVSVEDGLATLTGTVDSQIERSDAAENAIEGGAVQVRNRLTVK